MTEILSWLWDKAKCLVLGHQWQRHNSLFVRRKRCHRCGKEVSQTPNW